MIKSLFIIIVYIAAFFSLDAAVLMHAGKGYLEEKDLQLIIHLKGTPWVCQKNCVNKLEGR